MCIPLAKSNKLLSYDEYLIDPSSEAAKALTCPICCSICRQAVTLPCTHPFCKSCLEEWLKTPLASRTGHECPVCRHAVPPGFELVANVPLNAVILSLPARCPLCKKQFSLEAVLSHHPQCSGTPLPSQSMQPIPPAPAPPAEALRAPAPAPAAAPQASSSSPHGERGVSSNAAAATPVLTSEQVSPCCVALTELTGRNDVAFSQTHLCLFVQRAPQRALFDGCVSRNPYVEGLVVSLPALYKKVRGGTSRDAQRCMRAHLRADSMVRPESA